VATSDPKKDAGAAGATESPASYVAGLIKKSEWALGALGAVATAAVAKIGFDRLGDGDLDGALIAWALAGLAAFAVGVTSLIAAVVWQARAARVTIGYLMGNGPIAKEIRKFFEENSYLLNGPPNLAAFRQDFNDLQNIRRSRRLDAEERRRLQDLIATRTTILETARAERMRRVSGAATLVMLPAVLLTTLGAATFVLSTKRDAALGAEIATGELLPRTPTSVSIAIPTARRDEVAAIVGSGCVKQDIDAILVEIDNAPVSARPDLPGGTDVFHVVVERTDECDVADLWVPPRWVMPRDAPPASRGASAPQSTPSPTAAK